MKTYIKFFVIGVAVLFLLALIFNMEQPVATSTKSFIKLSEEEVKKKIGNSNEGNCAAMVALGDHFFFGLNNSYGAIFWYERAFACGQKDVLKYLKEIYGGLGLQVDKEMQRLESFKD